MKDQSNLIMFDNREESFFWAGTIDGIRFGSDDSNAWAIDSTRAILDSGSTCIIIPNKYFTWTLEQLKK